MPEDGAEIFLSPAVTYGPPGLDLSCPIAMTIAHCAEVAADNWTIRLKRQIQDKWEVRELVLSSIKSKQIEFFSHNFDTECQSMCTKLLKGEYYVFSRYIVSFYYTLK